MRSAQVRVDFKPIHLSPPIDKEFRPRDRSDVSAS